MLRPDLTTHEEMVAALRSRLNENALYPMTTTDVCRIAIEKMFARAFPSKFVVRKRKKMYIPLNY